MSAALDAAAKALDEEVLKQRWDRPDYGPYSRQRKLAKTTIEGFLHAVANSQQPISFDSMQTLRAHLGEG